MLNVSDLSGYGKTVGGVLKLCDDFCVCCKPCVKINCLLLSACSKYEGEGAVKIRFELSIMGQEKPIYKSHTYRIGKNGEYTQQTWRIPPVLSGESMLKVFFEFSEGAALYIKNFSMAEDSGAKDWHGGLRHNAHLGFWGIAPNNTMPAFELAAICGFPACIVVPKVTRDGVLVCIHDDTINKTARDAQGQSLQDPVYVKDKTYQELSEWEYGSYKNEIYKGTKLPLLSDFFDLCAKTGMRPMFSTHPGLTIDQWQQVKEMLRCRGLLKSFHIKSFKMGILEKAYSVFGTEIDGYTFDVGTWDGTQIEAFLNSGIDTHSCRVGIEVRFRDYTEQIAKEILDAGFFAAAWSIRRRDFEEYERLISWGVTEFTEDFHCSMGLNY